MLISYFAGVPRWWAATSCLFTGMSRRPSWSPVQYLVFIPVDLTISFTVKVPLKMLRVTVYNCRYLTLPNFYHITLTLLQTPSMMLVPPSVVDRESSDPKILAGFGYRSRKNHVGSEIN